MAEDIIVFEPGEPMTPRRALNYFWFDAGIVLVIVGYIVYRLLSGNPPDTAIIFAFVLLATGFGSVIISVLRRYPTNIVINQRLRLMKVDYLTAFGETATAYMDLTKVNYSLRRDFWGGLPTLFVYQNFFNNFITVDYRSNFSFEEMKEINELIKALKAY